MKKYLMLTFLTLVMATSQAAITVYEGFDYPATGPDFDGETGGSGWSGAWGVTGGSPGVVSAYEGTSLNNSPFPFTPQGGSALSRNSAGGPVRNLASTIDLGADSGPIYFSYLLNSESVANTENQVSFYAGGTAVLDTGIRNDDFRLRSGGSAQVITGAPVNTTTYFIAGFIDANSATNDIFGLNVYSGSDVIASSVDTNTSGDWLLYDDGKSLSNVIDSVRLIATGEDATQETRFDEFRMGTTWSDVTVVPEPSTFALLVLAGAGLFFQRRKRA